MKLLSWDQQLGLASPLNQSGKTKTPAKNETGLDASRHTQVSAEGGEKNFLLDILFHRMSVIAVSRQQQFSPRLQTLWIMKASWLE